MPSFSTKETIQRLAERVAEKAASAENERVRRKWMRHNAMQKTAPPVVCRVYGAAFEVIDPLVATDPVERLVEWNLRILDYKIFLGDDQVFNPWIMIPAVFREEGPLFGVKIQSERLSAAGSARYKSSISTLEDIAQIRAPDCGIDEPATARRQAQIEELLGGILPVRVNRNLMEHHGNPQSICLGYYAAMFRGIGELLQDMADRPEFVHALMKRLAAVHREAYAAIEREGLLHLNNCGVLSQYACCTRELPRPDFDGIHPRLRDMWVNTEGQDFGVVSPAMTEDYLFQYLLPLLKPFGLVNYGCCESHHNKWRLIRQIPNLRRVSVSPWTDLAEAVSEMGGKVIFNWRVNVTNVLTQASPEAMRREIREGLKIAGGCPIEIVLQDVETVYGNKNVLPTWVKIAREEADSSLSGR